MSNPKIVIGLAPTKILGRGRPVGTGPNQKLLGKIKPNEAHSCIWGLSLKKMRSIKSTASLLGISIKIRRLENDKYAIWRTT